MPNARVLSRLGVEVWKPVVGFVGYYEVSNLGRIKSLKRKYRRREKFLKLSKYDAWGHLRITLCRDATVHVMKTLHSVVLEAFDGPRPRGKKHTRHLDGDPGNNCLFNLLWGTAKENNDDKKCHGTSNRGEGNGHAKLTTAIVRELKPKLIDRTSVLLAAKTFGVSIATIYGIKAGRAWGWV
jgi:NUMOD4 motif/HNH endonuclease